MQLLWLVALGSGTARAAERCNGQDDDGDGAIDEGPVLVGHDEDGDGFGDGVKAELLAACPATNGWADDVDDCDDGRGDVFPGAPEECSLVDLDCDGAVAQRCDGPSSIDAGSAWVVLFEDAPWEEADNQCAERGGHLASIDGEGAQRAVEDLVLPYATDFWMGGSDGDHEGTWTWSDGTMFGYTSWRPGQPDDGGISYDQEDCTEITYSGLWNDRVCEYALPMVCERACTGVTYADQDGDGLGDPSAARTACGPEAGRVANALDCDDGDAALPSIGYTDADGDGFGAEDQDPVIGCDGEGAPVGGDCDDTDGAVSPGADDPGGDGVDSDCDGTDGPGPDPTTTGSEPSTPPGEDRDGDGAVDGSERGSADDAGGATGIPPAPPGYGCGCGTGGSDGAGALWIGALAGLRRRQVSARPRG